MFFPASIELRSMPETANCFKSTDPKDRELQQSALSEMPGSSKHGVTHIGYRNASVHSAMDYNSLCICS
jgi:hypothetical protein